MDNRFLKNTSAVTLELRANQFDVPRRIEEAVRSAMQRNKPSPRRDEIDEGFFLAWRNLSVIRIDEQAVVASQLGWIQVVERVGVGQFNASRRQDRLHLFESIGGAMMSVVAQEKDSQQRLRVYLGCL